MSLGFRCFLLVLVCFGAAGVYRAQEDEISVWLGLSEPKVPSLSGVPAGHSPVRAVLGLESRVDVTLEGTAPRARDRGDESKRSWAASSLYADELVPVWTEPPSDVEYEERIDETEEPTRRPDDLLLPEGEFPPAPQDGLAHDGVPLPPAPDPGSEKKEKKDSGKAKGYLIHVVAEKENLWKIAEKYLGAGHRHDQIRKLNPDLGANGDRLFVGMEIKVPRSR